MNCPRCQTIILTERERDSLLVDVCTACRGVWLDRGELEKLISRATSEFEELAPRRDEKHHHAGSNGTTMTMTITTPKRSAGGSTRSETSSTDLN